MFSTTLFPDVRSIGHLVCLGLGCLLLASGTVQAAPTSVLPGDYADFVLRPGSGELVAIDTENNQVVRFQDAAKSQSPSGKLEVGKSPCWICYKKFGAIEVYAVLCADDPLMYLALNAAVKYVEMNSAEGEAKEYLLEAASGMIERGSDLIGRRITGAPVMIPIRVQVQDAGERQHTLQYFVMAEVSGVSLVTRLTEIDQQVKNKFRFRK